jgi:hypothetical protein
MGLWWSGEWGAGLGVGVGVGVASLMMWGLGTPGPGFVLPASAVYFPWIDVMVRQRGRDLRGYFRRRLRLRRLRGGWRQ